MRNMKQLTCNICHKTVSTEVPDGTIIRGWIECPECIEKQEVKQLKEWMLLYNQGKIDLEVWLMDYRGMI